VSWDGDFPGAYKNLAPMMSSCIMWTVVLIDSGNARGVQTKHML
jgi:hypothetical protein